MVRRVSRQNAGENGKRGEAAVQECVWEGNVFILAHLVRVHEGANTEAHAAQQLTASAETMKTEN